MFIYFNFPLHDFNKWTLSENDQEKRYVKRCISNDTCTFSQTALLYKYIQQSSKSNVTAEFPSRVKHDAVPSAVRPAQPPVKYVA